MKFPTFLQKTLDFSSFWSHDPAIVYLNLVPALTYIRFVCRNMGETAKNHEKPRKTAKTAKNHEKPRKTTKNRGKPRLYP